MIFSLNLRARVITGKGEDIANSGNSNEELLGNFVENKGEWNYEKRKGHKNCVQREQSLIMFILLEHAEVWELIWRIDSQNAYFTHMSTSISYMYTFSFSVFGLISKNLIMEVSVSFAF